MNKITRKRPKYEFINYYKEINRIKCVLRTLEKIFLK